MKVHIPTPLRQYTSNRDTLEIQARTVKDVLEKLIKEHVQLRRHLYNDQGQLRNFVNIYVNEEDIRYLQKEATQLKTGDVISIIPSIAGGSFVETLPRSGPQARAPTQAPVQFTQDEIKRYSRHLILPEVGLAGQAKIRQARVLCVGTGGLGSPLALYLAAAGVGTLGLVDFDVVDFSNLQRQIIHSTQSIGRSKLASAKERVESINPSVDVQTYETHLNSDNALDILKDYDVVVDGTDNFPTRYLVNDACVLLGKPNVYGSIFRFEGQASVFVADKGPCYRCLYAEPPPPGLVPSCAEGGVLGVLPGIIGTIQANESLKLILGKGEPLIGRLLLFDALKMRFRELKLRKNKDCPVCGENPTIKELIDYEEFCGLKATGEEVGSEWQITPEELRGKLEDGEEVVLLDVREPQEWEIGHLEGAVLMPTSQVPYRVNELSTADDIVVYCHTGQRSARITNFLKELGFRKVKNLVGGIDAWSTRIDPSILRY